MLFRFMGIRRAYCWFLNFAVLAYMGLVYGAYTFSLYVRAGYTFKLPPAEDGTFEDPGPQGYVIYGIVLFIFGGALAVYRYVFQRRSRTAEAATEVDDDDADLEKGLKPTAAKSDIPGESSSMDQNLEKGVKGHMPCDPERLKPAASPAEKEGKPSESKETPSLLPIEKTESKIALTSGAEGDDREKSEFNESPLIGGQTSAPTER